MKCALGIILVLLLSVAAVAGWVVMPLESAVKESDIIVIGTLRNVSEESRDGVDYGSGEITVDEVLWGGAEAGQPLTLVWQNSSNVDCPRVEHREHRNIRAIWLLTQKPDGKVAADNPGRFVSLEEKEKVLRLLRGREKS